MTEVIVVSGDALTRDIEVQSGQRKDMVLLVYPGVSCDVKLDVRLSGEGAEANIYGAYICGDDEKVKISVDMHHDLPHCCSRQLFKGIAGGTSKVDFYGKIIVAQDAQKTEAYQENHNILLSDDARVDTKPHSVTLHIKFTVAHIKSIAVIQVDTILRVNLTASNLQTFFYIGYQLTSTEGKTS